MDSLFWGAVLRFSQALIQATPTILIGLLVAGVFRRLLGHEGTLKLFGNNSWRSLPQAWFLGMLLPVCSLGVIPIIRELRRAGVSGGTTLAFGLTAPLFNPISVLYGLTLADPIVILTFSFCSLIIVTLVGFVWDSIFKNTSAPEEEPPRVALGLKRMIAIVVFACRELVSLSGLLMLIGLLGVAALSLVLPTGYLQTAAEPNDPWAPLFMTSIAIPAYATPMTAMVQLASMFHHGNSIGAAFALLALGAGANIGLVAWMVGVYGVRRSVVWLLLLVTVVVVLAYGVDQPLRPSGIQVAGHTHAFDIYCAPFSRDTPAPFTSTVEILKEGIESHEIVSLVGFGVLLVIGILLRLFDSQHHTEKWLEMPAASANPRFDIIIPAKVLGGIALLGLVGLSIFGCYVYYPPPDEIIEEMRVVNTEVAASAAIQDWKSAAFWIPIYDDWTRKLQVSMILRGESLTPYQRAKADVLREKLELLEHEVEEEAVEESRQLGMEMNRAYARLRKAYLSE